MKTESGPGRLYKAEKNIGAGRWIIYLKQWIRVTFELIGTSLTYADLYQHRSTIRGYVVKVVSAVFALI